MHGIRIKILTRNFVYLYFVGIEIFFCLFLIYSAYLWIYLLKSNSYNITIWFELVMNSLHHLW